MITLRTSPLRPTRRRAVRYGAAVIIAVIVTAGSLAGCSGSRQQAMTGTEGTQVPWNNPLESFIVNGKATAPLTFADASAAAEHYKGRHIPFSFRVLPAPCTPVKVQDDPWTAAKAPETQALVQYQTSKGLVDIIETAPGGDTALIRSEFRQYASHNGQPGNSGTDLLVKVAGRYWAGMTIGPHGQTATVVWHEGDTSYLVEGPELGKSFTLQLAAELAGTKPILVITASASASASPSVSASESASQAPPSPSS